MPTCARPRTNGGRGISRRFAGPPRVKPGPTKLMPETVQPKGPSLWEALRLLPRLRHDPLGTMSDCVAHYGGFIRLPSLRPTFILSNPADIRHVMVTNADNYHKTGGLM